jgi:Flp pilus assembly protein TadG
MTRGAQTAAPAGHEPKRAGADFSGGRRRARAKSGEGGLAFVEFAFVLPILVVFWLGGVELTQMLSVTRKVDTMVSAAGDLVAQSDALTLSDVEGIFDMALAALDPFDAEEASLVVTAIAIDTKGAATVSWSLGRGTTRSYPEGMALNIALNPGSTEPHRQIVMVEAAYAYPPAVGYMLSGLLTVTNRTYFAPKPGAVVLICDEAHSDCK